MTYFYNQFCVLFLVLGPLPIRGEGPLLLSPLIEKGAHSQAKQAATVPPMLPGVESFAGYITIDRQTESNIFFWLFKAFEGDWKTKPLIVWFQGGPGGSSMYGLFQEIGPFYLDSGGKLNKREYPWCQKYNLMFVDNPIGAGFSFTRQDAGYANTETEVAEDLYSFIIQFYGMFPELGKNPVYLMGQSYAGKYIVAFAHFIHQRNKRKLGLWGKTGGFVVPLAGVAIGNGLTDPKHMMLYGDYLYELGMIDQSGKEKINTYEDHARFLIKVEDFKKAEEVWNGKIFKTIFDLTGIKGYYNYINDRSGLSHEFETFLNKPETRQALHVGNEPFSLLNKVTYNHLVDDVMQSVKPLIEDILNWGAFKFVTYAGQLDILCAFPFIVNVHQHLQWKRSKDYGGAKRCLYKMDGQIVGYYKTVGVLTEVMFRGCGHMVPTECPKIASEFLDTFIMKKRGFECY